jgi:hypothetical protein
MWTMSKLTVLRHYLHRVTSRNLPLKLKMKMQPILLQQKFRHPHKQLRLSLSQTTRQMPSRLQ